MLVRLRRDWFAPGGVRYKVRNGLVEVPEDMRAFLPSDAEVVSSVGTLPDRESAAVPGFGAKPAHEQALDQVAGAAPTHLIEAMPLRSGEPRTPGELGRLANEQAKVTARNEPDTAPTEAEVLEGLRKSHEALAKVYEGRGDIEAAKRVRAAAATFSGASGSTKKPEPESKATSTQTDAQRQADLDKAKADTAKANASAPVIATTTGGKKL